MTTPCRRSTRRCLLIVDRVAAAKDRAHVVHVEIIDNPDGTHGCYTEFDDGSAIYEPC